jgi:tripartite-type tricarboxylate transporter receptor subunit TctC
MNLKSVIAIMASTLCVSAMAAPQARVTLGYGPGGTDSIIRSMTLDAESVGKIQFLVVNKPGANGSIAVREYLKESPSNLNMLGVSGGQILFEALVNPDNNFINSLKFVGPVLTSPLAIAVNADSDIKSIADLFDRSIPKRKINIAVGGESHQMLVDLISKHSHHDIQGVRFKGGNDGYTALRGRHVDVQVDVYGYFSTFVPDIRILAVAQKNNMPLAPSIHKWVPAATMVNFFAIAINKDTQDTALLESVLKTGMTADRRQFWESKGYTIDSNLKADYVQRAVVPAYAQWVKILNKTGK